MAIYLGSTEVSGIYLGESGYGLTNVVKVYLGENEVWPEDYTVTFTDGYDGVCTSSASVIGISYGGPAYFTLSISFSSNGPGNVTWQGTTSTNNPLNWQAISGFGGYHSAFGANLYMSSYSGTSYRIRALVDGVGSGYIDFPPCEP